jgi:hypothetical protein
LDLHPSGCSPCGGALQRRTALNASQPLFGCSLPRSLQRSIPCVIPRLSLNYKHSIIGFKGAKVLERGKSRDPTGGSLSLRVYLGQGRVQRPGGGEMCWLLT